MIKIIPSALIGIFSSFLLTGCKTNKDCNTPTNTVIVLKSSLVVITDTSATIYSYAKDNGFTQPMDSFVFSSLYGDTQADISLTDHFPVIFNSDFKLVLHPSGKTHTITKVAHDNNSIKVSSQDYNDRTCTNDIFYVADDSLITCHGFIRSTEINLSVIYLKY